MSLPQSFPSLHSSFVGTEAKKIVGGNPAGPIPYVVCTVCAIIAYAQAHNIGLVETRIPGPF